MPTNFESVAQDPPNLLLEESHPVDITIPAVPKKVLVTKPHAGQLRLASPATINFTVGLLSAVVDLFPSTLFSIGGDKINTRSYQGDMQTQHDADGRTLEQAQDAFMQVMHGALILQVGS